jgi:hypothetical protein
MLNAFLPSFGEKQWNRQGRQGCLAHKMIDFAEIA